MKKDRDHKRILGILTAAVLSFMLPVSVYGNVIDSYAADEENESAAEEITGLSGGGYSATGQLDKAGYSAILYNATNGLPTSDANTILASSDGYIWIGGYSGLIQYDGNTFDRMDTSKGFANAKTLFEDSKGRLWVGTNDNGIVMSDNGVLTYYTYKDGLPSSSIRSFAENADGTIYVGTTTGIVYISGDLSLHLLEDERIENEYIIRLVSDSEGSIYGTSRNGDVFRIEGIKLTAYYSGDALGIGKITTLFADPHDPGLLYLGTEGEEIALGNIKKDFSDLRMIEVEKTGNFNSIELACGRLWIISEGMIGYLDEHEEFCPLHNIPLNSGIETMTVDYQGNLWFASSRQGVMKLVTSNFQNITDSAGLSNEVVNTTCKVGDLLYVGTDKGLQVIDLNTLSPVKDDLTEYLLQTRIRCITRDDKDNIWVSTYNNGLGLVCKKASGEIVSYNEDNGFLNNQNRCVVTAADGKVLAGSNGGLTILENGKITKNYGEDQGISNTVFLTVCEGDNGAYLAGTDGDGIYVMEVDKISHLGRDDGLTSDVILRIKKDEERGVYWIITSNSIEYLKDGIITKIEHFPYSNNYDMYFDGNGNIWILSSYGIYCVNGWDMLDDRDFDYRFYNTADGLSSVPTANSFSEIDKNGDLYISCRAGVCRVNINDFFDHAEKIKASVKQILCDDVPVVPDEKGLYTIPANVNRIQIGVSVLNYNLSNPLIKVFLEGAKDEGITVSQNALSPLEYTQLPYGDYTLHIQVLDGEKGGVIQDKSYAIKKKPRLAELTVIRILGVAIGMLLVAFIVWRTLSGTIIRRQYEQIRLAKEEADRANGAKSRFLANMSHEIRTPINTIMGMDEMILREDASGVPKEYHQTVTGYAKDIKNASESLLALINDVLDMSKIESGKMNVVDQDYDLADMLRSMITMIRVRAEQKDLAFGVKVDSRLPKGLRGDMGKIKQIVLNLLTNAVKYTGEGGFTLNVEQQSAEEESCMIKFSVKDTGIGIKPEDMEKLFSAFERFDEEKNSGIQGTGLGLDISRQFASLMGGELTCTSVYGEGSEFILTVTQKIIDSTPIGVFNEKEEAVGEGPYVPQFRAPDAELLVVDDNPMNLTVIKGLLKQTNMFITTATSGAECLEKLQYGSFNVVLLDHMMPGMDGLETIKRIREDHPDLPVYALTANSAAGGEEFYKSYGFNGYLEKPVDGVKIEKTILKHLPPEIVMQPEEREIKREPEKLPEEYSFLADVEGLSVETGVVNSGGVESFINSVKMFYETIDDNLDAIGKAYAEDDIKMYTIKVHALKSSARIIGADKLSRLCQELEDAGNAGNTEFIGENNQRLTEIYSAYKDKLSGLAEGPETSEEEKEPIPESELEDAYGALTEVIPQMDYDSVEMIISQVMQYKLSDKDKDIFDRLEKHLKKMDWETMEALIGERS